VRRTTAETGLPWNVVVGPGDASVQSQDLAMRRRLLSVGLGAIVLLLAGGSYMLWRVVQRELTVARLQADFVSAVSHEFRTPLTSLRHITELLEENDTLPPERRQSFYAALGRSTVRLHRLVESLLDFGRMELGRKPYDMQPADAGAIAAQVVADFQNEPAARGFTIHLEVDESPPLRADATALSHAVWNLLDNAIKYSQREREVWVSVQGRTGRVAIAVRDQGLGIPPGERKEIFRKFMRGERAKQLGIKGTGLGLAIVSHIVDAHGGAIELESEEGQGSTFRLVLPARG
jgi:two-component system phosphate regulon sensor histidine kinase PhoR